MARPDTIALSDRVHAVTGGVNAAIVSNGRGDAIIIDSGGDKGFGQRMRKACEALALTPAAIVNTHAHADHFGGNDYLVRHYDLPVLAPAFESELMQSPYLEPVYLYHGARPLPELQSKWLMAPPSRVDRIVEAGVLELAGIELELIDTSGHAHRQLSVRVDGVLIAADALFGHEVLERYPLPFGQDVGEQVASAERLRGLEAHTVLPGHGTPTSDIDGLVDANLAAFERAAAAVERACAGGGLEEVLASTCAELAIELADLPRYHLNLCTVAAYLGRLRELGRIDCRLEGNRLLWRRSGATR